MSSKYKPYTYNSADPASDSEASQASDEFDPKLLLERDRKVQEVRKILADEKTPFDQKVKKLATTIAQSDHKAQKFQREANEYEVTNDHLRAENNGLMDRNWCLEGEDRERKEGVEKLTAELEALKEAHTKTLEKLKTHVKAVEELKKTAMDPEKWQEMEDEQIQLKQKIEEKERQIKEDNTTIQKASAVHEALTARLAQQERATAQQAADAQRIQNWLLLQNAEFNGRMAKFSMYIDASRRAEVERTEALQKEQARLTQERLDALLYGKTPKVTRMTTGTVDREMQDAFETDAQIGGLYGPHVVPSVVRVRRRVAKPKTRVTRPGTVRPRAARPPELRKGYTEHRAASTYLQYKDGRGKESFKALKLVGRHNGISNSTPRKRTRLEKGSEFARRAEMGLEEIVRIYEGCRGLPRALPTIFRRRAPSPYDKRDDRELSKLMQGWSLKPEKVVNIVQSQKDQEVEAKLVTITKTIQPFMPRPNILTHPRYLPKQGREVTHDERRKWSKKASNWSLGPGERKKPSKKVVRFAEKVEFEPPRKQPSKKWEPQISQKAPGWSFNWSHLIIAFLLFLLFVSNMGSEDSKVSWEQVNTRPDDIVAKLRSSGQASAKPTIIDYEVARWSDVNPSIYG
ncbi:hypothetical protein BDV06DRAFT_227052 [Aspergillus oleicola]